MATPSRVPSPVLVTGASTGIGRATVDRLVADGVEVIASVRRQADEDALVAAHGDRVRVLQFDVTDHASVRAAIKGLDRLGGLVNNAGAAYTAPLEHVDLDALRHHLEVNLIGQIAVTQACLPLLREHGPGARIISIGSMFGRIAAPLSGPYHMGKFALAAFSDSLRAELADTGIDVVLIEPGAISTKIWERGQGAARDMREGLPAEAQERYAELLDMGDRVSELAATLAIPADICADAIVHQLATRRPAPRRLVGLDARSVALIERLPARLRAAVTSRLSI